MFTLNVNKIESTIKASMEHKWNIELRWQLCDFHGKSNLWRWRVDYVRAPTSDVTRFMEATVTASSKELNKRFNKKEWLLLLLLHEERALILYYRNRSVIVYLQLKDLRHTNRIRWSIVVVQSYNNAIRLFNLIFFY